MALQLLHNTYITLIVGIRVLGENLRKAIKCRRRQRPRQLGNAHFRQQ